ncbi:Metallo-beta-lactamase superfamily protein [Vibrio celticus]|uniref:Metallo-beta-lactamase superfamily protein n=1 Tax=Vibrio celticus TaxID=446372 RepID=A0A1C3JIA8_9VIBR|nr:Metallo-beta-lactamase superfamily protein [Vibrio celticus]
MNPSLFRQGMVNYEANGLYKVRDGIWQVRGADITNMTIYRTDNGYLIHDPLLTEAAGAAAWEFAKANLPKINGEHKITGVIYSHSHQDHFGGSRGIIDESTSAISIRFDTTSI